MVKLFFIPEMAITITDFVKPTLSTLLSEVWTELISTSWLKHDLHDLHWLHDTKTDQLDLTPMFLRSEAQWDSGLG